MDCKQGKKSGYLGTCGLVSCVNVLRLAGINATEADIVTYASNNGLCWNGDSDAGANGGTSYSDRKEILAHYGIESGSMEQTVENIAKAVSQGRGVIASVHASTLYYGRQGINDLHAITVTSVQKNKYGDIEGFYVCDSNAAYRGETAATFYPVTRFESALSLRPCNVTEIIR